MPNSYDEFSYPCFPQTLTHPANLATQAALHGLSAVPPEACSVLEIGCNNGANLIPMAANEPGSHFTGIDLAGSPIEAAREFSARLGLDNTEFLQADVTAWDPGSRRFDYIVLHGVYSWVPPHVREAILALCRASLSPNGVAYVSYNALPGCHFRQYVWDLLRYHTRGIQDPHGKIAAARSIATRMVELLRDGDEYQKLLKTEFEMRLKVHESVLLHDDLVECNTPFHLSDFVRDAAGHGLQYLCDAEFTKDFTDDLELPVQEPLARLEYADYLTARRFRSSLLCHGEVELQREIRPEAVLGLLAACPADPEPERPDGTQRFRVAEEKHLTTNHPVAKRVLNELAAKWPAFVPVAELPLDGAGPEAAAGLVLRLHDARALDLRTHPPRLVSKAGERPEASALARLQLALGMEVVTNQCHRSVDLTDALSRHLLQLLDGTRDRAALLREMVEHFDPERAPAQGPLPWPAGSAPATRLELALMLERGLEHNLAGMARLCLLTR